jgi:hypothetical protein
MLTNKEAWEIAERIRPHITFTTLFNANPYQKPEMEIAVMLGSSEKGPIIGSVTLTSLLDDHAKAIREVFKQRDKALGLPSPLLEEAVS